MFGLKLVSFFEGNIQRGQAPLSALVALFSDETGQPLAVLEGSTLTGLRTGAAAALGAKCLARKNSEVLLVVGAGHQCVYQVGAMLRAVPTVRRVLLHDAKSPENARAKAAALPGALEQELSVNAAGVSIEGQTLPESRSWTAPFWPGPAYIPTIRPSVLPWARWKWL